MTRKPETIIWPIPATGKSRRDRSRRLRGKNHPMVKHRVKMRVKKELEQILISNVKEVKRARRTRKPYTPGQLKRELFRLRGQFARAAQSVLNQYDEDYYGGGGICDDVAMEMAGVAVSKLHDVDVSNHGWNDHAWIVVWNQHEAWAVDIPPGVYETGGGYKWKVDTSARISSSDVVIYKVNRKDWVG